MKKLILLSSMALLAVAGAKAQSGDNSYSMQPNDNGFSVNRLRFGVYVAPTTCWMRPTASKNDDGTYAVKNNGNKIGFMYGIMAEYYFAPNYALVTGLQVDGTGGKISAVAVDQSAAANKVYSADFNYKLQYVELPLALKLRTNKFGKVRLFGQFGFTAGVNTSKKASYDVDYTDDGGQLLNASGSKERLKGTLSIAPVMMQMNIGVGAEYPIADKLRAYGGIFFNNGFSPDITNPNKYELNYDGSFKDGRTRLNNIALRIGLLF
ncbi:porin family protein [Chitinophagaceae bacterium MMS25-I14]